MALLKLKNEAPPGGWWYIQKETHARFSESTLAGLAARVIEHRRHRQIDGTHDVETVKLEIQRQICERLGERQCTRESADDPWTPMPESAVLPSLEEIKRATTAGLAWLKHGAAFVDDAERHRRAALCLVCPLNSPMAGCQCGAIYKMVEAAIPKTKKTDGLWICGACKCSLNVKVNLPAEAVMAGTQHLVFPNGCWQKEKT